MGGSVTTVQEGQTEGGCRLQFLCAVITFSTGKTAMRTNIAAAAPALDQIDPEAPGWVRGSVRFALNQAGLYIICAHNYMCVSIFRLWPLDVIKMD